MKVAVNVNGNHKTYCLHILMFTYIAQIIFDPRCHVLEDMNGEVSVNKKLLL